MLADATQAALLLRYALMPRERPTSEGQYRRLLDRYRTDTAFADLVGRVADGLGLDVRVPTPLGLVASGRSDGPFAVTLANSGLNLRTGPKGLQDRRCYALVLVALAAYAYPHGEALVDTANPTIRAQDLERFLDSRIAAVLQSDLAAAGEQDEQLGEAALMWTELPSVQYTTQGRLARDCRREYVDRSLDYLGAQGRARRESTLDDERGKAYVVNDRFRVGIAEIAESLVFGVLAGESERD